MINNTQLLTNSTWGLAYAWYAEYLAGKDPNDITNKMDFLIKYNMKALSVDLIDIDNMNDASKEKLFQRISEDNFTVSPHFGSEQVFNEIIDTNEFNDNLMANIDKYAKSLNIKLITTTPGSSHRYDRVMPFEKKVEYYSKALSPIAKFCKSKNIHTAIENHADYFVSEIIDIIVATDELLLFFDTANALHIGEQPYKAAIDAAPYTIGTHFKDHYMVKSENNPLHYEIRGCALGEGDAELEKCYKILMEKCPYKNKLIMFFELFHGDDPAIVCFEKSVRFVRRLQEKYGC